jgi:flagellar hook assembly protein FlgD
VVVVPEKIILLQAFPNPFTNITTIRYSIADAGNVQLKVFDISGKVLSTLVNGQQAKGDQNVEWNPERFPCGVYIIQLKKGMLPGIMNWFWENGFL